MSSEDLYSISFCTERRFIVFNNLDTGGFFVMPFESFDIRSPKVTVDMLECFNKIMRS